MKRHISIVLGMALLPVLAMAAPNFSGAWVRDNAKSDAIPNQTYWLTRDTGGGGGGRGRGAAPAAAPAGGAAAAAPANAPAGGRGGRGNAGGRGGNGPAPVVMTVQQDANSLSVADPQGAIRKYTLDGKPVTRATETGIQKAVTTANLQGDTLVIGTTQPFGGMPGNATLEIKEVWSLTPDGKTLTVTTTRTLPAIQKIFKQVYNLK